MARIERIFFAFLELLMVLLLASMSIMVFGNVVLRYLFNSGLDSSDELSRFAFIWLTFIGAAVAVREGGHLGVDMLVRIVPPRIQAVFVVLSQVLMALCCVVFAWGMWKQHDINMANSALITEIPLGIVYGVAYFSTAAMFSILVARLFGFFMGRIPLEKLMALGSGE